MPPESLAAVSSTSDSLVWNRRNWLAGAALTPSLALASGILLPRDGLGAFAADSDSRDSLSAGQAALPADPSQLDPKACLALLYEGNRRFVEKRPLEPHRKIERLQQVAPRQTPFAAFLGCADSRVPIEIIFDQGFGDLFVTRIAGNIASSENIGSLEFGTLVLGCKVLYVLGHTGCGAVTAAALRNPVPGQISGLFQFIRPAVRKAKGNVEQAVIENVRNQAQTLAEASPVVADLVRTGKLIVAGGVYDLKTGVVSPVEIPLDS